jgi:hypothetical protein
MGSSVSELGQDRPSWVDDCASALPPVRVNWDDHPSRRDGPNNDHAAYWYLVLVGRGSKALVVRTHNFVGPMISDRRRTFNDEPSATDRRVQQAIDRRNYLTDKEQK